MAIENWLTGSEMTAITIIAREMSPENLGELGGDVLRIPMSKLKKAGYTFRGCDIASDYKDLPKLRASFKKIDMNADDTDESIVSLAEALTKVLAELCSKEKEDKPTTLRELGH